MAKGGHSGLYEKEVEFVGKPLFCKFTSVSKDGSPHATPIWFMYENDKFIITTAENSVKARNIRRDDRVTLLIDDAYKYVMVKGRANINQKRDVAKDTEKIAIRYVGEEGARKRLPDILKVKHVSVEVTPRLVISSNL